MYHQARAAQFLSIFVWAACLAAPAGLTPIDENGYRRLIAGQRGKVVLVNFWATWCAPCRKELPDLVRLETRLRNQGFVLITISADEPEQEADAVRLLEQSGVRPPAYIRRSQDDDRFITAVDPGWSGALPALFLYDRQGKKLRSWVGETSLAGIERAIRKFL